MINKSSFMLAMLLIANPFVLLFFQNCSGSQKAPLKVEKTDSAQVQLKQTN